MIYVADGVRFPGLRGVFHTLFEIHDIFGGSERIQERHFAGLHNVRVVIQDVERSGSVLPKSFREPDYAEVGRARILFICPNHGSSKDPVSLPTSGGRVPVLH